MAGLFDLPNTRSSKGVDRDILQKSKSRSTPLVATRGTSLIDRITLITQQVESKLGKYKDDYEVIRTEEELEHYITTCIANGICALDTETTGLNVMQDDLAGVCLYTPYTRAVYIPVGHVNYITHALVPNQLSKKVVSNQLQRLIDHGCKMIMYNANFDIRVLYYTLGIKMQCYFDCDIASRILNENERHGLKNLHQKYVLDGVGDAWSFGKLFDNIPFTMIPINVAYLYAARDPKITYELYEFQVKYLTVGTQENIEQELEGSANVFWNIEMPFLDVCIEMEDNGIAFDFDYQQELHEKYHKLLDEKLEGFYKSLEPYMSRIEEYKLSNVTHKLSDPINISSPQQLSVLFYDILKCESVDRKKPRGTGEDVLEKLKAKYKLDVCDAILEYRKIDKLINTYIDKLPDCVHPKTGKIHAKFNQYGAKTGRLSSEDPNMQNIPSHNTDIRKLFIASPNHVIMSSDYSQQEPRCMAALCGDEGMLQAYREGKDLYAQIASVSFHRTYEDCLEFYPNGKTNKEGKEYRSRAKGILLGVLYGRGIDSIAEQLNCSTQEAQNIKDSVFKGFPAIKQFEEDTLTMAEQKGYVTTFWGRKRRLPEMMLPDYEYVYKDGKSNSDLLDFDSEEDNEVPYEDVKRYNRMLQNATFGKKRRIFEKINKEGVEVIDNTKVIQDATRQCVNARIQGKPSRLNCPYPLNLITQGCVA